MSDCTNDLIDKLNYAYCKINALNIELKHYNELLTKLEKQNEELINIFEELENNNKKLKEDNINLKKDIDILQEENKLLKDFNLIEKY